MVFLLFVPSYRVKHTFFGFQWNIFSNPFRFIPLLYAYWLLSEARIYDCRLFRFIFTWNTGNRRIFFFWPTSLYRRATDCSENGMIKVSKQPHNLILYTIMPCSSPRQKYILDSCSGVRRICSWENSGGGNMKILSIHIKVLNIIYYYTANYYTFYP